MLRIFENVFSQFDLNIEGYREVPVDSDQLDSYARGCCPEIRQAYACLRIVELSRHLIDYFILVE